MLKIKKYIKRLRKFNRSRKALKKLMKRKNIEKIVQRGLYKRYAKEKRLKFYGISTIVIAFIFLISLIYNIFTNGYSAFFATSIKLPISFSKELIKDDNYLAILTNSLEATFPEVKMRRELRKLYTLISSSASYKIREMVQSDPTLIGKTEYVWLKASSDVDMFVKGKILADIPEHLRKIKDIQIKWIKELQVNQALTQKFNWDFFKNGDSRDAESAGILGSLVGSLLVVISCMAFAFPIGVLTAIYLEEFAPKNKLTDFIEVNINNLAAVPSIIFGLLGLAVYIQFFGIPRSAALAGGLTLALMATPIIVIATRTSIRAIPNTIKDAAFALGASKVQVTLHHILPLAMPGIMTGTILGIARIIGETAPLLMIGMVAFIVDIPGSFFDPATAMPVQIYIWADSPEAGFVEKTSAAIIILLFFLVLANAAAVYLRKKFAIKW